MNNNVQGSGLLEIANALSIAVSQRIMNQEHAKQVWNKTLDLAGINTPKPVNPPKTVREEKAEKAEVKAESPKAGV